jgi:lipid A ethanolaminephosphotransferase
MEKRILNKNDIKLDNINQLNILYKKNDYNIILLFGESMRYDKFKSLTKISKYKKDLNFKEYKTISLATSTDITIPLFMNNAKQQNEINISNSLMKLAKEANFSTYFISSQSQNALKYIKRYLNSDYIDYYTQGAKNTYDSFLIKELKKIDLKKKSFITMQFVGQHSPYDKYPSQFNINKNINTFKEKINSKYNNTLLYTDFILDNIIKYLKEKSTKPTIIIFTSDHGELLGKNKKYGHNVFEKEVFMVPSFIYTIKIKNYLKTKSIIHHLDLVHYIRYSLGYEKEFNFNKKFKYRVNGTMMSGEDGYLNIINSN